MLILGESHICLALFWKKEASQSYHYELQQQRHRTLAVGIRPMGFVDLHHSKRQ